MLTVLFVVILAVSCSRDRTLTADRAKRIILGQAFETEPVYAEVPIRVTWSPAEPKDDFDELSLQTLTKLEKAGFVTVKRTSRPDGSGEWVAAVTKKGFNILGDVPSARGPALRGRIAEKHIDGVRNFVRHPDDPSIGSAELIWHYEKPTPLYGLFDTKIDKPIGTGFASVISIFFKDGTWQVRTLVAKQPADAGK